MGIIESTALSPVCNGSFTGWRATMPGALYSSFQKLSVLIGPSPSIGLPKGSTTRPMIASPTGTSSTRPVQRTSSPSLSWR